MQAIIHENDLDANGCLSFDEFMLSMVANMKTLSEEEHRYISSIDKLLISLRHMS